MGDKLSPDSNISIGFKIRQLNDDLSCFSAMEREAASLQGIGCGNKALFNYK